MSRASALLFTRSANSLMRFTISRPRLVFSTLLFLLKLEARVLCAEVAHSVLEIYAPRETSKNCRNQTTRTYVK